MTATTTRTTAPIRRIEHVYLLHNGLNETNDLLFHYRLAAWIVKKRPNAVCILRPLPGHLTRFPFHGPYAATPLDGYLRDPADLFRQFVRYMLETQWLLSALVPRARYHVAAGTALLAEASRTRREGRANQTTLAKDIHAAWQAAFDSNARELDKKNTSRERNVEDTNAAAIPASDTSEATDEGGYSKEPVTMPMIRTVITELRQLLNWKAALTTTPPGTNGEGQAKPEPPCIHVVGYSMGGFVAQAVFFAWPFAVSSCTNMFAGGALRDLAPTAFADPEEWQAALHAMRYELDRSFREGYLTPYDGGLIAGIEEGDFGYFTRIFYEVFLQYYRGGYSSRVSEFSRRLLFVVGGDDPIVRTKNVLDAGPRQGVTLLQIADVSHFPGGHLRGDSDSRTAESEQRMHWLPEVGRVIANFSERSEGLLARTLAECWNVYRSGPGKEPEPTATGGRQSPDQQGEQDPKVLDSTAFASEMNHLVERIERRGGDSPQKPGWLLIARNEVPPVFLGLDAYLIHGQAVHHSEEEIARYIETLRDRSKRLIASRDRISLLIPKGSEKWFGEREERERFFSKSETASSARIPPNGLVKEMWELFEQQWIAEEAVGVVATNEYAPEKLSPIGPVEADRLKVEKLPLTSLPDVWIAMSEEVCKKLRRVAEDDVRVKNENAVVEWAARLAKNWSLKQAEEAEARAAGEPGRKPAPDEVENELRGWIDGGEVMAIAVSPAELNPRYRGHRLVKPREVRSAIIHWGLAYRASDRCELT
jgi:hypothetical protein